MLKNFTYVPRNINRKLTQNGRFGENNIMAVVMLTLTTVDHDGIRKTTSSQITLMLVRKTLNRAPPPFSIICTSPHEQGIYEYFF